MFIVVEGVDAVGKTEFTKLLHRKLQEHLPQNEVVLLRAPSGPIRDILLDPKNSFDDETELLLFIAGHKWLISNQIAPAFERGAIVVCDRFMDSTVAYQGGGRNLGVKEVRELMDKFIPKDFLPDHTIYLSASEEVREKRLKMRGMLDRMDAQGAEFRRRIDAAMNELAQYREQQYFMDKSYQSMAITEIVNNGTLEQLNDRVDEWVRNNLRTVRLLNDIRSDRRQRRSAMRAGLRGEQRGARRNTTPPEAQPQ